MHMLCVEGSLPQTDFNLQNPAGGRFILGGSIHESGHLEKSPAGCAVSEEVFQTEQIKKTKSPGYPLWCPGLFCVQKKNPCIREPIGIQQIQGLFTLFQLNSGRIRLTYRLALDSSLCSIDIRDLRNFRTAT